MAVKTVNGGGNYISLRGNGAGWPQRQKVRKWGGFV